MCGARPRPAPASGRAKPCTHRVALWVIVEARGWHLNVFMLLLAGRCLMAIAIGQALCTPLVHGHPRVLAVVCMWLQLVAVRHCTLSAPWTCRNSDPRTRTFCTVLRTSTCSRALAFTPEHLVPLQRFCARPQVPQRWHAKKQPIQMKTLWSARRKTLSRCAVETYAQQYILLLLAALPVHGSPSVGCQGVEEGEQQHDLQLCGVACICWSMDTRNGQRMRDAHAQHRCRSNTIDSRLKYTRINARAAVSHTTNRSPCRCFKRTTHDLMYVSVIRRTGPSRQPGTRWACGKQPGSTISAAAP